MRGKGESKSVLTTMRQTRRGFLGLTSATAAGMLASGGTGSGGREESRSSSTEHFFYRTRSSGPYIDSQRENIAFALEKGAILLSEDNGRTWPHRLAFADAELLTFSHILKNGNIVFATRSNLYVSTDNLKSFRQITVTDSNGADYLPHAPQDPANPGWYFNSIEGINTFDVDGAEMLVWGNYCNVTGGAAPVNIYYSTDNGETVKIAYSFGQNPFFRDNGSPGGGETGTLLGDPFNPILCRHVHSVSYNPDERAFYACTGDIDRGAGHECHWLRGTYHANRDKWYWKVLVSVNSNSRYKSGGINFIDGQVYWISDANSFDPEPSYDRGIFRCAPADIADPKAHNKLFNADVPAACMIIQGGVILAAHIDAESTLATGIVISLDLGKTWAEHDLKELGKRSAVRFHQKNGEGWFRADLRSEWIHRAETIFIMPKL
jgi:hypothetical protein